MSSVRARCARMYSTAGTNRCVRKVFGQVLSDGSWIPVLRVRSSNAAAASVLKMNANGIGERRGGQFDRVQRGASLSIDLERFVEQLQLRLAQRALLFRRRSTAATAATASPRPSRPAAPIRAPRSRCASNSSLMKPIRSFERGMSGFHVNGASTTVSSRPSGP